MKKRKENTERKYKEEKTLDEEKEAKQPNKKKWKIIDGLKMYNKQPVGL